MEEQNVQNNEQKQEVITVNGVNYVKKQLDENGKPIKNPPEPGSKEDMRRFRIVSSLVFLAACAICAMLWFIFGGSRIPDDKTIDYRGTHLAVSTYTDYLTYSPLNVAVDTGDYNIELALDLSDVIVDVYEDYVDYAKICYINGEKDRYTTLIITDDLVAKGFLLEGDTMAEGAKKLNAVVVADPVDEEMTTETGEKKIIRSQMAVANLYGHGQMLVYDQCYVTEADEQPRSEKMINGFSDMVKFSKDPDIENEDFIVEFEGLATVDMNKFENLKGNVGTYFGNDIAFRFYNEAEDQNYAWITHMNNSVLESYSTNFERHPEYSNVYVHKNSEVTDSINYRSFAVQGTRGCYYVKVWEFAPEDFEQQILDAFGIKESDTKLPSMFDDIIE